jgi:type II secretion system protein N
MAKPLTLKAIRPIILYTLWGIGVFAFSLYLTFPIEKLKPYLEEEASRTLKQEVTFEEIETRLFTGLALKKVRIQANRRTSLNEPPATEIQTLKLWLNPFFLLFGETMVSFDAKVKGGTASGKFSTGEDYLYVDLAANALPLEELKFLQSFGKFSPEGKLTGEALIETELKDLRSSEGVFNLKTKQLTADELSIATTMGDLKFQNLNFTDVNLAGQIDKGKVTLNNVKIGSGSMYGSVTGTITMGKKLELSTPDLTLQFKVDNDLHKRFGFILDQFLPNKTDDGFYVMQMNEPIATYWESFGKKEPSRPPRIPPSPNYAEPEGAPEPAEPPADSMPDSGAGEMPDEPSEPL